MSLWARYDGEPWLDNPSLYTLNRRRKRRKTWRSTMNPRKRDARGRFVGRRRRKKRTVHRAAAKKVHRRRRHVARRAGTRITMSRPRRVTLVNPRRRRHYRRYRRNDPGFLGFDRQSLTQIGGVVAGMIGTPFVEGYVLQLVPSSLTADKTTGMIVRYGVKIASVAGLSFLAKQVLGRDFARTVLIGGGAYIAMNALQEFGVLPGASASAPAQITGLRAQPLLGEYQLGSYITQDAPERLQPEARF
jgi:hypothetical protein